ncbi:potassium transporter TrkA [Salipaludibacillus sp. LMS25]|uniref:cation:proton antiporter regulatory subunit n=1 Tax=Salipaludibacillus sp. LMS25 TaxID=2924031 RepID=UPI0020D06953|nr:TrkA C-terminal domain-containing protein [Salipaludibacillus sp. LMS25]UTR13345.1 potassium transporter TrkA [Salipaludibacillus sp. LMS25]
MKFNMVNLPGVGKKLTFINGKNQMMGMVIHHSGKRELYFFEDADDDEAVFTFDLSSEETQHLGTHLLSATLDPIMNEKLERLQILRKKVIVEWLEISKKSSLVGISYETLTSMLPSGVSIVGIFQDDEFEVAPPNNMLMQKGHTIMVVGKRDPVEQFIDLCESEDI